MVLRLKADASRWLFRLILTSRRMCCEGGRSILSGSLMLIVLGFWTPGVQKVSYMRKEVGDKSLALPTGVLS